MYIGPGFYASLKKQQTRHKEPNRLSDISDGTIYQEHCDMNGPLSDGNGISVVLNTDGIALFNSSNSSMWPILLMINELPFVER